MDVLTSGPVTAADIARATVKDTVMAKVVRYLRDGWPSECDDGVKVFLRIKEELSLEGKCILRGMRVVVPPLQRPELLADLHQGHPAICQMKSLARSFVWWPGIDEEIEEVVKTCEMCQQTRTEAPCAPLHAWEWPHRPWDRIHLDYTGPVDSQMVLVMVDTYSKWLDVGVGGSCTSSITVRHL